AGRPQRDPHRLPGMSARNGFSRRRSYLRSGSPSASPTADPIAAFCANLHQLGTWFSADVADANGDDVQLAQKAQGQLSGVMMWFHPNEQAITDPQARAAADGIITDALALQNWTSAAGTSFSNLLDGFTTDSGSFVSRHCS